MTSSLVGSEMCIRDRRRHWRRHLLGRAHFVAQVRKLVTQKWVAHTSGAVSYTHLTLPTICSV
eukprot:9569599-Prorocentrum_lima.AAC.1